MAPTTHKTTLAVEGLTKKFGGLLAADSVTIQVSQNTVHGLIGPNGAGKTTVFNMISGVLPATAGSIRLLNEPLDQLTTWERTRCGVARTFQNIRMFGDMRVIENVITGMHSRLKSGIGSILVRRGSFKKEEKEAEAIAREHLAFVGLEKDADRRAGDLSYGNQRRLEIARALASQPKILLLDEPAAGMNPAETHALIPLLQKLRDERGLTLLLVEHDMHLVMSLCDRITVINFGKRIADGTPAEVREHPAVIEAYLGHKSEAKKANDPASKVTS
ncbi:MAG: ABC transporter ATP-binding protein [Bradyrhizobium sp.]|nr:ABC transporter ATP-binding protein [Bradyrhizobium sp.]